MLLTEGVAGEMTLTFVDRDEIAALNVEHMGTPGPTDVLSFPLDEDGVAQLGVPVLLGDVVVCPAVAAGQAADLLVVHGVLHVLGHDHAEPDAATIMRRRELELLERLHCAGPAPAGFRQHHVGDTGNR